MFRIMYFYQLPDLEQTNSRWKRLTQIVHIPRSLLVFGGNTELDRRQFQARKALWLNETLSMSRQLGASIASQPDAAEMRLCSDVEPA